jgi:hypothetical protein
VGEIIGAAAAAAAACLNAAAALGKLQAAGVRVSRCLDPAVAAAFDLVSVVAVDLCGYAVLQRKLKQQGSQVSTNQESLPPQQQKPQRKHGGQQQPPTQLQQVQPPQPPQPPVLHLRWQYTEVHDGPQQLLLSTPSFSTTLVTALLALYGWQLQQHLSVKLLQDQAKQEQIGQFDECMVAMQQLLVGSGAAADNISTQPGSLRAAMAAFAGAAADSWPLGGAGAGAAADHSNTQPGSVQAVDSSGTTAARALSHTAPSSNSSSQQEQRQPETSVEAEKSAWEVAEGLLLCRAQQLSAEPQDWHKQLSALADGFNAVCIHHRTSVGFTEQQLEAVAHALAAADSTPGSSSRGGGSGRAGDIEGASSSGGGSSSSSEMGEGMLMGMQRCLLIATAAATLCPAAITSLPKGPLNTLQTLEAEQWPWRVALFRLPMVLLSTASAAVHTSGEAAQPLAAACVFTCHDMQQQLLGWGHITAAQGTTPTLAWLWQNWASNMSGRCQVGRQQTVGSRVRLAHSGP